MEWVAIYSSKGIFLTQGSNPSLLCFLLWQADSSPLSHLGSLVDITTYILFNICIFNLLFNEYFPAYFMVFRPTLTALGGINTLKKIVYLLMATLGLCCYTQAFSNCGVWTSHCSGFSYCRAWTLGVQALVVVVHEFRCSLACEIFLDQRLNTCPLHFQADS